MSGKYKIFIIAVITVLIIAAVGYYAYEQYKVSKTQSYLKTSSDHQKAADNYLSQAYTYQNRNDYANAIIMLQKGAYEIKLAIADDNEALPYANGVYGEYLDNDISLLQAMSKLIEYKIYINQYNSNTLNPGQEKANPSLITPYINSLESEIAACKENEKQIIAAHPNEFQFLK